MIMTVGVYGSLDKRKEGQDKQHQITAVLRKHRGLRLETGALPRGSTKQNRKSSRQWADSII